MEAPDTESKESLTDQTFYARCTHRTQKLRSGWPFSVLGMNKKHGKWRFFFLKNKIKCTAGGESHVMHNIYPPLTSGNLQ